MPGGPDQQGDHHSHYTITSAVTVVTNAKTAACVREMVKNGAVDELKKCFGARMEFGTAGLRAAMGPGVSRMNDLTIIQTTQGFCRYLEQCFADLKERGVVIGFDAREHTASGGSSKRFASLAAAVLISRGVPAYLFSAFTPTPYVPFTVSHLGLCAGIMVTASHNPKQDNGYKVYWENGAQIIPPHDKGIAAAIEENLEPWPESWDTNTASKSPLLKDPYQDIHREYLQSIQQHCFHREVNKCSEVKIVHTSVHGVGHVFVQAAFKAFDLRPPYAVKEQEDPDPEFPTVEYPNPEEGAGVLNLSFALADREGATVVFANDPDADRLAVAEKQPRLVTVYVGCLCCYLLCYGCCKCRYDTNLSTSYFLPLSFSLAKQLLDQGKTVLFAFEEAIGYMCSPAVLDKDGVSAAAIAGELVSYLATKNTSLSQQLKAVYDEYGYHLTKNSYFICHDQNTIKQLFERLRNYEGEESYPKECQGFAITAVRDLTTGYDSNQPDSKAILPTSKSSQMITFTFANGGVATMRTSGTEPKIKYYTELCAAPGNSDLNQLNAELNNLVDAIVENFFQPKKNNLTPRPDS
uniref:Phosphoglucomutase 2 n=1 Tax=Pygocentrus nattereri TaxID=42514 RepID=A0AAR2ITD2_PYGNA